MQRRLDIPACPVADVLALERELGVSGPLAQVLVRRGLGDPAAARAWLAAADEHPLEAFGGIAQAVGVILDHVRRGSRITIHGDYDVDGVCATAILVNGLRTLGASPDWHLPSRSEDGYGLSAATVDRLAARGTSLLVTVDCAITAVEEVASARAAGMDVVVTDHHQPRAGALPDAPIVHPALGDYPCPELCAAGVAHKLVLALAAAAGVAAPDDLDLVALATVADCVPLRGENRRLVREGLRALAATRKPGLRALMRSARVDPGALDARTIGFRLAPRINAAGRLYRADAGLELVLTDDPERAEAIAAELDAVNGERRHTETRILFEAEAQVAATGEAAAYVLAGDGWHPGVIGIVASRIAERHHRPVLMIALPERGAGGDGAPGTGSGRSIPGFDLLGGLDACAEHLLRHGGHRAAAGCTVDRASVGALRAAFTAHAAAVLRPEDLVPAERVDAVVAGDELGLGLAEELELLAPFGMGNPDVSLLVPAARLADARTMGEGKHVRFTVESGGTRARAVAFGSGRLPEGHEGPLDATFTLERNEWAGAVEPRLVLRHACPPQPAPIRVLGEPADFAAAVLAELAAPPAAGEPAVGEPAAGAAPPAAAGAAVAAPATGLAGAAARRPGAPAGAGPARTVRDRRGGGIAGTVAALVASREPVLVACADGTVRTRQLDGRLGGFALCSWAALEREPALASPFAHVVALDPPLGVRPEELPGDGVVHLAWGEPETAFALAIAERDLDLRAPLAALYRELRDGGGAGGGGLETALRGPGPAPRPAALAGRLLRVLTELRLAEVDGATFTAGLLPSAPTRLERSATFRDAAARLAQARRRLAAPATPAAPAGAGAVA